MQLKASKLGLFTGRLAVMALISATVALPSALAWQLTTEQDDQHHLPSVLIKPSDDANQGADQSGGRGTRAHIGLAPTPAEEPDEELLEPKPLNPEPMVQEEPAAETETAPTTADAVDQATPDQEQAALSIKASPAKFNGIQPGKSTTADVKRVWGDPIETIEEQNGATYVYSVKPFERIEITLIDDLVDSILIHLERPFDLTTLTGRLQLDDVEAVDVADDLGEAMGQSFPERGVLFSFAPGDSLRQVSQIFLESIDSEPFVLRVKSHLHGPYTRNLDDLKLAIRLDPNFAEAYWLKAKILLAIGEIGEAEKAAATSVEIDDMPEYRLTWAACLAEQGNYHQAVLEIKDVLNLANLPPVIQARGLVQMGDLVASADARNYVAALKLHTQAIGIADPLALDRRVAVRRAAKEILIDAHLGVAHDIGWGNWRQKETIVPKWIDRASAFTEEMIDNEQGSLELRLRITQRALAALAGFKPSVDPTEWVDLAKMTADDLLRNSNDSLWDERVRWELGMAYYHTLQIHHIRREAELGLKFGRLAEKYLRLGAEHREIVPDSDHLVGRLFFQIGAIYAIHREDHTEAAAWYDKATPRLAGSVSNSAVSSPRQQGEALVSMGVSYWQIGERDKAITLTDEGVQILEQAVVGGVLDKSALAVSYGNLAAMHDQLGNRKQASEFSALAGASKSTQVR